MSNMERHEPKQLQPPPSCVRIVDLNGVAAALALHTATIVCVDGRPELRAAMMFGPRDARQLCGRRLHLPPDADRLLD